MPTAVPASRLEGLRALVSSLKEYQTRDPFSVAEYMDLLLQGTITLVRCSHLIYFRFPLILTNWSTG